ncbi:MAG: sulfotransferase family protein [Planctomycetota bacterium]|jgi:hypothetical protein
MEAQNIWDRFRPGEDDVVGAEYATPEAIAWHRWSVARVLALRGARRFLAKYPRLSLRLDWLDVVFPGAIFVHMQRDWRAVVSSTVVRRRKRQLRRGGWFGARIPGWRWLEGIPDEIVGALVFRYVTKTLEAHAPRLRERCVAVRYEDLCREPIATLRRTVERCELSWTREYESLLPRSLTSANYKWRARLDRLVVERIRAEDPEFFSRYEERGAAVPAPALGTD